MKRRDISNNRCYQILYTCTMYFQGRIHAQLKKADKSVDELQQKYFVGVRYQNVTKLCPPFGRYIGAKRFMWVRQSSPLSYLHILLICLCKTSCLEPGQDNVYTIFLKENVCSGYSLVAALSNVNDSFTLTQCPTVTLEERSKRRNFGRITPNFGLFQ